MHSNNLLLKEEEFEIRGDGIAKATLKPLLSID
jgi:hypothetical protein